jgi:hypothetical protein
MQGVEEAVITNFDAFAEKRNSVWKHGGRDVSLQSMRKISDRRTWLMYSASGLMWQFLHRTRMSDVFIFC